MTARCPICRRPTLAAFRPFCSRRCADVDLGRWLGGSYAIAVTDRDDDEDGENINAILQAQARAKGDERG
ncbi:MAG: DNA gyrase inhibitor YacG [Hyphomicrobiaceae bacterium]